MSTYRRRGRSRLPKWLQITVYCVLLVLVIWNRLDTTEEQTEQLLDKLYVYYLDVGQADCTVLVSNGEALLIDAGNNDDEELVVDFLSQLGIERLAYAVGTHSHEDHIGGLDAVIRYSDPDHVIMPEEDRTNRTYTDVLDAIEDTGVPVIRPVVGKTYQFGGASFQILGPSGVWKDDPNGYSVCLRVTYGETHFLFTGDAEAAEEKEMLESGLELSCDVFQAGHHGSSTSNTPAFLQAADPIYTVISCGADNEYGHPHWEVVAAFEDQDVQMYRTDQAGTILAVSDGEEIHWEFEE